MNLSMRIILHCHWNVPHVMLNTEFPDPIQNHGQHFQVRPVLEQVVDGHLWSQVLRI